MERRAVVDMDHAFQRDDCIQDHVEPFAKVLNDDAKGQRCDHCFRASSTLKRCTGCALMHYCGKSCQAEDWKLAHKIECKSDCFKLEILTPEEQKLMKVSQQPTVFKRQILRVFAILKLHPEMKNKPYRVFSGKTRTLRDLLYHHTHLDDLIVKYVGIMASQLAKEGHGQPGPIQGTCTYLQQIAGIWQSYSFVIQNGDGSGIYIESSIFKHSCRPNALVIIHSTLLQIWAFESIPKGVEPRVAYLPGMKGHRERTTPTPLQQRYPFQCECPRCQKQGQHVDEEDYEALNRLISKASLQEDWTSYYKTHQEILKCLRKLYHEYDERITDQFVFTFKEAQGLGAPRAELTSLAKEMEDHLRVTYGERSLVCEGFMRLKKDLGLSY